MDFRRCLRKITSWILAVTMVFTLATAFTTLEVRAASSKSKVATTADEIRTYFPESYWSGLIALKEAHPNWNFQAFYSGTSWEDCFTKDSELYPTRNLTYAGKGETLYKPTSWYSTAIAGSYNWAGNSWVGADSGLFYQSSEEAIRYCMDPRNFFDETNIFMFLDSSMAMNHESALEACEKIFDITGVSFWHQSLEDTNVYYETQEDNPEYAQYLTDKAAWEEEKAKWESEEEARKASESGSSSEESGSESSEESGSSSSESSVESGSESSESSESSEEAEEPGSESSESSEEWPEEYPLPEPPKKITVKHYLTYAEAIVRIAEELNVNAVFLAVRVRQEHGGAESQLITGTYPFTLQNGESVSGGYYNYFDIGAGGNSKEEIYTNGLREAYEGGWDTRYKALQGGAKKYLELYISRGQTTLYSQKFNVDSSSERLFWGQYMQNLTAPQTEALSLKNSLSEVLESNFTFLIPVFNNMPVTVAPCPTKDGNPNYKLGNLLVFDQFIQDGENPKQYALDSSFGTDTLEYAVTIDGESEGLRIYLSPYAETSTIRIFEDFSEIFCQQGSGFFEVSPEVGEHEYGIVCTAENGDSRVYQLELTQSEHPPEISEDPSQEDPSPEDPSQEDPSPEDPSQEDPSPEDPSQEDPPSEDPSPEEPTEPDYAQGDLTGDTEINSLDLLHLLLHLVGDETLDEKAMRAADINGDHEVNSLDLLYLLEYMVGDIRSFPERL